MVNNVNTFTGYLGSDFQLKLFWQILTEFEFGNRIFPSLEVTYFDDQIHKQYFIVLKNYFIENERVPSILNKSIFEAIENPSNNLDDISKETILAITDKIVNWNQLSISGKIPFDGDVVQTHTYQFIKQQEYRKLASYIIDKTKQGAVRTGNDTIINIEEKIKKIANIDSAENDGEDVFSNIDDALEQDHRETIPTGVKALDELMGGGLGKSEIGIVLAASGTGKTTALTKFSNTALNLGKNVLQIIFEDNIKDIKRKHYSIWSGVKLSELSYNRDFVKQKAVVENKKIKDLGGNLTIVKFIEGETTLLDIDLWIKNRQKKLGLKYDMVSLDYLDCLEPHKSGIDPHDAELANVKLLIKMADEYNIPIWTSIQGNRTSISSEFITTDQMGGNIKRAQKSHFLMSVAKSPQQKTSGTANISILKARFASDGQQFKDCIFNNDTMEIRITDGNFKATNVIPKYNKEDLEKIDMHDLELHNKISNTSVEITTNETNVNDNELDNKDKMNKMLLDYKKTITDGLSNNDENFENFLKKSAENQGNIEKDQN